MRSCAAGWRRRERLEALAWLEDIRPRRGGGRVPAAIQRLQTDTAARPFSVLERVPGVAGPARVVHVVHDAAVAGTHVSIRAVTQVVSKGLDVALDALERDD